MHAPTACLFNTRAMVECVRCGKSDLEVYRLIKCPVCFKQVCDDCAVRLYGKYFCSNTCAQTFFYDEGEEDK